MLAVAQYYGPGDAILKGSGVKRDSAKAFLWLKSAADDGSGCFA
jgi:TPR repeat protein